MKKYLPLVTMIFLLSACMSPVITTPTLEPTALQPASTALPTTTLPASTESQPTITPTSSATNTPSIACQLSALVNSPIYQRPSAAADIFGTLSSGERVQPAVKTADGFYGFDPAVAQAGNVGVFRYRWILKTYQISTQGDCANLPVVLGPIANLCYAMVMGDAQVYESSDATSTVIATLHTGDYASVISSSPEGAQVDLNVSSINMDTTGWIKLENIGYNGNCEPGP